MGRTKRLRLRKRNDMISDKCASGTCLFNYMSQFSWKNEKKLLCRSFPDTGRGLCSKINIPTGDVLIELPLKSMITLATLENDTEFREVTSELASLTETVPFQSLLALYLVFQNHLKESKYRLYLESIPKAFSMPYFCNSEELYFLPDVVLKQTVDQNKKIRSSYKHFQDMFGKRTCSCCDQSFVDNILTLEEFKWAYFAVNSRSVFLTTHEVEKLFEGNSMYKKFLCDRADMALAPFLDMFNHSDSASTISETNTNSNTLYYRLITNNSFKRYEQVFISYGDLSNLKLLTEYGFSLKGNTHDFFEVSLADIENLIATDRKFKGIVFHSNKFKFIRDHNLDDQMFINAQEGVSHNLQVVLFLIFKERSHYPNVLNQTAFGSSVVSEESVSEEAQLLSLFKINEYQNYVNGLLKQKELSISGQVVIEFLEHSISYLKEYLDKC